MAEEQGVLGGRIQALLSDIDDWCGTGPRRWPFPKPKLGDYLVGIAIGALSTRIENRDMRQQVENLAGQLIGQSERQLGG